jgi:hypothetical protein
MMEKSYRLKFHAGIICDALHRNIDDTFESVSFEIHSDGLVQVKIILDILSAWPKTHYPLIISKIKSILTGESG